MALRKSSLDGFLDHRLLRRLAGARAFERGEGYFASGQVGDVIEQDGTITAKVRGTRPYRVKLWRNDNQLNYHCTCPVGDDGVFCKHGVALGLAWLDAAASRASTRAKARPRITLDDVRAQLLTRDKRVLVDLLMQQAVEDDGLRRRLLMEAASHNPKGLACDLSAGDRRRRRGAGIRGLSRSLGLRPRHRRGDRRDREVVEAGTCRRGHRTR